MIASIWKGRVIFFYSLLFKEFQLLHVIVTLLMFILFFFLTTHPFFVTSSPPSPSTCAWNLNYCLYRSVARLGIEYKLEKKKMRGRPSTNGAQQVWLNGSESSALKWHVIRYSLTVFAAVIFPWCINISFALLLFLRIDLSSQIHYLFILIPIFCFFRRVFIAIIFYTVLPDFSLQKYVKLDGIK